MGTVDELLAELSQSEEDVILSSEEFTSAIVHNIDGFKDFVKKLRQIFPQVVIVIYLRSQAAFLRSNYFERLKSGLPLSFEEYVRCRLHSNLSEFPLDYTELLGSFSNIEGIEVIVRPYDAVSCGYAPADFLEILGMSPGEFGPAIVHNAEQSATESLILFYQNQRGRPITESERAAIGMAFEGFSPAPLRIAKTTSIAVRSHFGESNKKVAERYGLPDLIQVSDDPRDTGPPVEGIFSPEFLSVIDVIAMLNDRLGLTHEALATAQGLAFERYDTIRKLETRLNETTAGLQVAQRLAVERLDMICKLQDEIGQSQLSRNTDGVAERNEFAKEPPTTTQDRPFSAFIRTLRSLWTSASSGSSGD